ncbi:hypothetical protein [Nonomuraea phyllanthi]|nr:hypothetical protein [Nonomuraea phyllanthi]
MPDAIQVHQLVKNFGRVRALDGLDMTAREGEVHGFTTTSAPSRRSSKP